MSGWCGANSWAMQFLIQPAVHFRQVSLSLKLQFSLTVLQSPFQGEPPCLPIEAESMSTFVNSSPLCLESIVQPSTRFAEPPLRHDSHCHLRAPGCASLLQIAFESSTSGGLTFRPERVFHIRLCTVPINNRRPSGRHLPAPRTPHPAPRIFEIDSNGACLREANPEYRK